MAIELVTGHSGAAHVSGADAGAMHAGICGSDSYVLGAVPSVTMSDANTLTIQPCDLMIEGRHVRLSGTNSLSIRSGAQTGKRNDLVYVRYTYDSSTGVESAKLGVKEGATATTATDPALDNPSSVLDGATIADVAICRVSLNALTPTATWLLPQLPTLAKTGESEVIATGTASLNGATIALTVVACCKIVTIYVRLKSGYLTATKATDISAKSTITLPEGYRPSASVYLSGISEAQYQKDEYVNVSTDGTISVGFMCGKSVSDSGYEPYAVTFVAA